VQHLEVWYGQKKWRSCRAAGRNQHRVNYRHVIDWLVRKPGAFADYRYQADLFPAACSGGVRPAQEPVRRGTGNATSNT